LLYSRLQLTAKGPGFVHFPREHPRVDEEFFAQLTAEKLVTRYRAGLATRQWVPTRPRNEALDCAVLNLAALRLLNPRLEAMAARVATPAPRPTVPPVAPPATPPGAAPPMTGRVGGRRFSRSSYLR
jgi:phage terminase large subunit GpA-like protein